MFVSNINIYSPTFKRSDLHNSLKLKYAIPLAAAMLPIPNVMTNDRHVPKYDVFCKDLIQNCDQKTDSVAAVIAAEMDLGYTDSLIRNIMRERTITIDPGHGGVIPNSRGSKVTGAIYKDPLTKNVYYEKDINLSISKKIKEYLELFGAKVVMTRDSDSYVNLTERAIIAQDNNSDIFVSVHADFHKVRSVRGSTVYKYVPELQKGESRLRKVNNKEDNELLAKFMNECVSSVYDYKTRGIWGNDFRVLREANVKRDKNTKIPAAVLVETGFLSNPNEAKLLIDEEHQDKLAMSIAKGIIKFSIEKKRDEYKDDYPIVLDGPKEKYYTLTLSDF